MKSRTAAEKPCEYCETQRGVIVELKSHLTVVAEGYASMLRAVLEDGAVIRRQSEALETYRRAKLEEVVAYLDRVKNHDVPLRRFRWDNTDGWKAVPPEGR